MNTARGQNLRVPLRQDCRQGRGATWESMDGQWVPDGQRPTLFGVIRRLAALIAAAAWVALMLAIGSAILLGAAITALPFALWALGKRARFRRDQAGTSAN